MIQTNVREEEEGRVVIIEAVPIGFGVTYEAAFRVGVNEVILESVAEEHGIDRRLLGSAVWKDGVFTLTPSTRDQILPRIVRAITRSLEAWTSKREDKLRSAHVDAVMHDITGLSTYIAMRAMADADQPPPPAPPPRAPTTEAELLKHLHVYGPTPGAPPVDDPGAYRASVRIGQETYAVRLRPESRREDKAHRSPMACGTQFTRNGMAVNGFTVEWVGDWTEGEFVAIINGNVAITTRETMILDLLTEALHDARRALHTRHPRVRHGMALWMQAAEDRIRNIGGDVSHAIIRWTAVEGSRHPAIYDIRGLADLAISDEMWATFLGYDFPLLPLEEAKALRGEGANTDTTTE